MTIKRIDGKETKQLTRLQYEGELTASSKLYTDRIGEIVIDIEASPQFPSLWVANVTGHLNPIGGGGGFNEIIVNGETLSASESPALNIAPAAVEFCNGVRPTVGIDLVQISPMEPARLEFRVTPTGIPIDNPFGADFDMSSTGNSLQQDFQTIGDEVGTHYVWDLSKNPLAGIQCFDLGILP